jgi:hypothetical protein
VMEREWKNLGIWMASKQAQAILGRAR